MKTLVRNSRENADDAFFSSGLDLGFASRSLLSCSRLFRTGRFASHGGGGGGGEGGMESVGVAWGGEGGDGEGMDPRGFYSYREGEEEGRAHVEEEEGGGGGGGEVMVATYHSHQGDLQGDRGGREEEGGGMEDRNRSDEHHHPICIKYKDHISYYFQFRQ